MAVVFIAAVSGSMPGAFAQTINHSVEGGMDIEITYPEQVIVGRDTSISILLKNNGWEDKQDISFEFSSQDKKLVVTSEILAIEKISQGGSYGSNIDVSVASDANPGTNFLNVRYSHVLVANNETPQPAIFHDMTIPITLKESPNVVIYTKAPESIFAAAEFPIQIEVTSEDIDIMDVSVKIIPPDRVGFRGETHHAFSIIKKENPVIITSRIITPPQEIETEYRLPFEIIVEYTNDIGERKIDSETVSLVLRPRVIMELTTEGGIWIGDFFIAPYVSLGTIIGIPAGAIFTLIIRRKTTNSRRRKRST